MLRVFNKTLVRSCLLAIVLAGASLSGHAVAAGDLTNDNPPSAAAMLADAALLRPLGLVGSVIGVATFVVTLPFSILGWNLDEAGQSLVVKPVKYTFVRPLGDIN